MTSPSEWPVEGLLAHITGQGENGFRVVDVWESQEAVDRFAAELTPILDEIGVLCDRASSTLGGSSSGLVRTVVSRSQSDAGSMPTASRSRWPHVGSTLGSSFPASG
jgi:hypothetical protein